MKAYKYDFVQIDLAIDNRSAQERIIPLAKDLGMGVLINSPFGRNRVFQKTAGKPLPDWAKEIDATSWAQSRSSTSCRILGDCAIPGTARCSTSPTTWAPRAAGCPMLQSKANGGRTSTRSSGSV